MVVAAARGAVVLPSIDDVAWKWRRDMEEEGYID